VLLSSWDLGRSWHEVAAPSPVDPVMSTAPVNIFVGWSTALLALPDNRLLQISGTGCDDQQIQCDMYAGIGRTG
jgi:hypothetical protein